ncbi:MAG: class I SAM-dependent methyltransferase [bacterium]
MDKQQETKSFYDEYWPKNIPDYSKTKEHVFSLLPQRDFKLALDAGCGTGVCSLALSEKAEKVMGVDISGECINTAKELANKLNRNNIEFKKASLLELPFKDETFDLVFSWGVIHHTVNPIKALDELVRILQKDGVLILAVYLKTNFTFFHEAIRKICLRLSPPLKNAFIKFVTSFVKIAEKFGKTTKVRDDTWIEAQVEDWFFVPEKHFFKIEEMKVLFEKRGLSFELLCPQTGRFKSSSNFIVRGVKK